MIKNIVPKKVRGCILYNNETRLKGLNPCIHSYWRDLHVRSGCVCVDNKVAIPNVLRKALFEDIHASHPGPGSHMHGHALLLAIHEPRVDRLKQQSANHARQLF